MLEWPKRAIEVYTPQKPSIKVVSVQIQLLKSRMLLYFSKNPFILIYFNFFFPSPLYSTDKTLQNYSNADFISGQIANTPVIRGHPKHFIGLPRGFPLKYLYLFDSLNLYLCCDRAYMQRGLYHQFFLSYLITFL